MTQERVPLPNSIDPENLTMDSLDWDKDQIFSSSQLVDLAGSFVDQIKLLNELIETYNSVLVDEKLRILSEIEQLTQTIRDKYPSNFLTGIKNYQENINDKLWVQIHKQQELLSPAIIKSSIEDIVAHISPGVLVQLMQVLSEKKLQPQLLDALYLPNDNSKEADRFRSFLAHHTIRFLGGSNSRNFEILNKQTHEVLILKLEYRLGAPKEIDRQLRNGVLKDTIVPIFAERQAIIQHNRFGQSTCSLLVLPFSQSKDLSFHSLFLPTKPPLIYKNTIKFGIQMADIFLTLQAADCAFSDGKAANILVNTLGNLEIADTKAFIPTVNGLFSKTKILEKGYHLITTDFMNPPELVQAQEPIHADSMHVYMLGKNLYQIMAQYKGTPLQDLTIDDEHFQAPVFKTLEGELFKKLIQGAIEPEYTHRITLTQARQQLQVIDHLVLCRQGLLWSRDNSSRGLLSYFVEPNNKKLERFMKESSLRIKDYPLDILMHQSQALQALVAVIEQIKSEAKDSISENKFSGINKIITAAFDTMLSATSNQNMDSVIQQTEQTLRTMMLKDHKQMTQQYKSKLKTINEAPEEQSQKSPRSRW